MYTNPIQTWRNLLETQIKDLRERQRLADIIGVHPHTLVRWAKGTSKPKPQKLALLLPFVPFPDKMLTSIAKEYPEFDETADSIEQGPQEIPASCYNQVFRAYAEISGDNRFWSIASIILQSALKQLDPMQKGLAIFIQACMPPAKDNTIHSLRAVLNVGSPPWTYLAQRTAFFGAESLSGFSVTHNRSIIVQDINEKYNYSYPLQYIPNGRSYYIHPIQQNNHLAGCIWVGCTQAHYFTTRRAKLIEAYAHLLQLAFKPDNFYHLTQIQLKVLPPIKQQFPYLAHFNERVKQKIIEITSKKQSVPYLQIEQMIWQQFEQELSNLMAFPFVNNNTYALATI